MPSKKPLPNIIEYNTRMASIFAALSEDDARWLRNLLARRRFTDTREKTLELNNRALQSALRHLTARLDSITGANITADPIVETPKPQRKVIRAKEVLKNVPTKKVQSR